MRARSKPRTSWDFSFGAALALLCPFDLVASLGMDLYLPAVPDMPVLLGASASHVQLTLSVYLVLLGAGQLLLGPLSDRIGRRPILLGGTAAFVVASLALVFVRAPWPFVALRVAQAAGGAAMLVATFATVRDVYAGKDEGSRIYAVMGGVLVLVPAFGPLLGATLYRRGGLGAIFATLAAIALLAGLRAVVAWPETRPVGSRQVQRAHVRRVLARPELWVFMVGHAAAMGSFFVYLSIAPSILVGRYGLAPLAFAGLFGTVALVLVLASQVTPRIVARYGLRGALARGLAAIVAGALLALGTAVAPGLGWLAFVAPMWVVALGIALVVAVAANGALAPFADAAGTATALFHCASSVLQVGLGTLAVVLFPERSAWPLVVFGAGAGLFGLVLLAVVRDGTRPR